MEYSTYTWHDDAGMCLHRLRVPSSVQAHAGGGLVGLVCSKVVKHAFF